MSLARLVVTAVRVEGRSKSEVARDYRVSRRWVQELVKRYDAEGEAGLEPRSRRPHTSPQRTPESLCQEIVELRKTLADQGLDAGAHTIAFHLEQRHGSAPAPATIWRILSQRGFVTPQPHKRPKSSYVRFEAELPNERWQADLTHWKLAGGTEVDILNILDDHSRLVVASHARSTTKAADVVASFHTAAAAYGFPASLLTDNGAVFTATPRGGRCAIELELDAWGSPPATRGPTTPRPAARWNASTRPSSAGWPTSPARRPSPDCRPSSISSPTTTTTSAPTGRSAGAPRGRLRRPPQGHPARPGLVTAQHHRVRHDKVDPTGVITLRHNSRLHHIGVGRRHAGVRVLVLVADLDVRVITDDGELLRELTLDPAATTSPSTSPEHGTMSRDSCARCPETSQGWR